MSTPYQTARAGFAMNTLVPGSVSMSTLTAQASLIYGASGTYKTTQVGRFSEYITATTGLRTRVISAETAGVEPLLPYIEMGMEVLWLSRDMSPRSALRKLARGEWPQFKDGRPVRDKDNRLVWIAPPQSLVGIGGYACEGLTSFSDIVSQELKSRYAKIGEATDRSGLASAGAAEEGETFGGTSMAQVGAVQDIIMEVLREMPKNLFNRSAGQIIHVLFTAHESKGTDETTQQSVFGPGTMGKAITGKLFKEVGTALHLEQEIVPAIPAQGGRPAEPARLAVWAYYRNHPDSTSPSVVWTAKPRIPAIREAHEEMARKFPGGRFELTFERGLNDYLEFQDQVHVMAMKVLAARRAAIQATVQAEPMQRQMTTAGVVNPSAPINPPAANAPSAPVPFSPAKQAAPPAPAATIAGSQTTTNPKEPTQKPI